jgi:hypothetical protein
MRKFALCIVAAIAVLAVALPASAQLVNGTIRGTVTDPTGSVVVGAQVVVKNEGTGLTRTLTTNSAGEYVAPELPVGSYEVSVSAQGFKPTVFRKIALNVSETRAVNAQLSTGGVQEELTVEASAVAVQTEGGDVSGLVSGEQARELPLNGRNFFQLTLLMPGVSAPDGFNPKDKGLLTGSDLSVSGGTTMANLWMVDGTNNNDVGSQRTILVYPSVDAIDEVKIQRNSFSAEYGQAGGGTINVITKSGTNEWHGSVYEFNRSNALAGEDYFLQLNNQPKQSEQYNDFGATLGGPIIKDKLHFFYSEEWNRENRGVAVAAFVPTAAERAGNFSGPGIAGCSGPTPVNPATGQPFPGNQIPSNLLSPGGQAFISLYPLPNVTPAPGSCNNFVSSSVTPIDWRQENARLDWTMSNATRLMVRYTQDSWTNNAPNAPNSLWGDNPYGQVQSNWSQPGKSLTVQLNSTIGKTAVNTLQFSYSANAIDVLLGGSNPGLAGQINSLIPTIFPTSGKLYGSGASIPVFWGGSGYSMLGNEAPFHNNENLYVLKDDYSQVFGKHELKVGILGSYNEKNEDNGAEQPSFWGATGFNTSFGPTTGNLIANFLLRGTTFGFSEAAFDRHTQVRWKQVEAYAQDSWKITPRMTFDYGVRYSYFGVPYSAENLFSNFDPASFNPALGNDPCNGILFAPGTNPCAAAGFQGGKAAANNSLGSRAGFPLAPRLGFAWDINGDGKSALRAGAGQYYNQDRVAIFESLSGNPPFVVEQTGERFLDSNAPPCAGCFNLSHGAPNVAYQQNGPESYNIGYNVTYQREIAKNTTFEIGYVGSQGRHLLRVSDINEVPPNERLAYIQGAGPAALRPFGVFGNQTITYWENSGKSSYNSMQTQLVARFWRNSQFQASYTLAKLQANDPLNNSSGGINNAAILDRYNEAADYGPSPLSRTHVFNANLILGLPTLEGQSSFVKNVFGDWQLSSIVNAYSGAPITVYNGGLPGLAQGVSGTGYTNNQRPNAAPGVACNASTSNPAQILNPNAYTLVGYQLGADGNSGVGSCTGPGFFQVDMSLRKNVKLSDKLRLQLSIDIYNLFNTVNFFNVNNTFSPSSLTLNAPLASATQVTGQTLPANFGQAQQASLPRQAQFGVKLSF